MEKYIKLKEKIEKLKSYDKNFEIFGSKEHLYKFNKVLTTKEIEEFENKYEIIIPDEYKKFLLYVGDGGCGPYYGLYPLKGIIRYSNLNNILKKDFPYIDEESQEYNFSIFSELCDDESYDGSEDEVLSGCFRLCEYGCEHAYLLEVTGNNPGRIWFYGMSSDYGIYAINSSFYDWYESWLDTSIRKTVNRKLFNELENAILNDNIEKIEKIIKNDDEDIINALNEKNDSPLFLALNKGNYNTVKTLLENGARTNLYKENIHINWKDRTGDGDRFYHKLLPLHYSILMNYFFRKNNKNYDPRIIKDLVAKTIIEKPIDKKFLEIVLSIDEFESKELISQKIYQINQYSEISIENDKIYDFKDLRKLTIEWKNALIEIINKK